MFVIRCLSGLFLSTFSLIEIGLTQSISDAESTNNIGHTKLEYLRGDSEYFVDVVDSSILGQKPISIDIWFPTDVKTGNLHTTYSYYIDGLSQQVGQSANRNRFKRIVNSFSQIDSIEYAAKENDFLSKETLAYKAANFPDDRYPLILILGGLPIYHFELAELVASRGFVVASIPRMGINQGSRMPFDSTGSEEFIKDLEFTINMLSSKPFIDSHEISFITWSFEGIPTLTFAWSKPSKTKILISLDSSIGYNYGKEMVSDTQLTGNVNFPVYHFSGLSMEYGKDFELIDQLKSRGNNIIIDQSTDMGHGSFTSLASITIPSIMDYDSSLDFENLTTKILSILTVNKN